MDLLRNTAMFSTCNNAELGRIASLTTEHSVVAGQVLMKRGTPGLEFFIIVEGNAKASRKGVELAKLGPGSFFGELALLDGGERTADVVAETDMRLLVLSRTEFSTLFSLVPSVSLKIIREMGTRLRRADEMLDHIPTLGREIGPLSM
jgi:CRP/FNR family cyclic AMP-dependent transcriptional regulator